MENTLVRRCPFSVKGVLPTVHSSLGSRGKPRQLCTTVRASPLRPAKSAQLLPEVRGYDDESSRLVSNDMASTSGTQDVPGEMSFSATRSVLYLHAACAGAFLLSAGSASAMELSSQVSWLPVGSMHDRANFAPDEAAELAELLRVPEVSLSPFQVLTFLLQHPLITLGVAAALYFLVPRLFRALVRYLVVPLALALALYVVSLNPAAATSFAQGSFNFIVGHPVETSAVIIVALAFALSPYILVLGAVLVLVTGVPSLPPFLRPVVPAPVLEAQRQASELQQALQKPLAALGSSLSETTSGLQRSFDGIWTRGAAPAPQLPARQEVAAESWDLRREAQRAVGEGALFLQRQLVGSIEGVASSLGERR